LTVPARPLELSIRGGMTQHHSLARTAAAIALTAAAAGASLFAPEWSRPLPSEVVSFAVWQRQDGPDDLMLLLADGRVFAVSGTDTITLLGRAPSGTRAIAAVPSQSSVNNRQSDIGMALLLAGSRLVAWDRQGTELWQKPAGVLAGCDSLAFVGWHEGVTWLIARGANDLLLVTVGAGTLGIDTIVPGMRARAVQMLDVDGSGLPEVCATDGRRVCIGHLDENRRTDIYWPSPPLSLAPIASPPTAILAVADPDNTGTTRLLVVTGDTLRCLDPLSGRQEWFAAAGMGLPGAPRAVAGTVSRAYVAGADSAGRLWLLSRGTAPPNRFSTPTCLRARAWFRSRRSAAGRCFRYAPVTARRTCSSTRPGSTGAQPAQPATRARACAGPSRRGSMTTLSPTLP
jgi:hypothetical protein